MSLGTISTVEAVREGDKKLYIVEEALSDGSCVYDVVISDGEHSIKFHATDQEHAEAFLFGVVDLIKEHA